MLTGRRYRRLVLGAAAVGVVMVLLGVDWSGTLGTYLPCRRNWGWLPSYLPRASPIAASVTSLGTTRIKLCYGSPRARGRRMIGGSSVPFGRLWRTGANEPTTLRLSGPLLLAGIPLPTGKVSLYTVPGPETWEIIVNRATGQWGLESEYTPEIQAAEIGRVVVGVGTTGSYYDELTIDLEPVARPDSATLVIRWERTEVRIPLALPPQDTAPQ